MALDVYNWVSYLTSLAERLDMEGDRRRVDVVVGDARALRDCAKDLLEMADAAKNTTHHERDLDKRLLRVENYLGMGPQHGTIAAERRMAWLGTVKCHCAHPDADFVTAVGRRICSYCGDEAVKTGPQDLKTRQR